MAEPVTSPAPTLPDVPGAAPRSRFLGSAAVVSVALLGVNALAYVFTVAAARALAPAAYGELASLLSVLLVGTVPATGLQTTAALFLGGRPGGRATVERLHATTLVVAATVCALGALAAAPLRAALHLPGTASVIWVVVMLLPHTLIQGYQGLVQGAGRYGRLSVITVAFGVVRLAGGLGGLFIGGTPAAALAGMTAGALLGALAGWFGAGRPGLRTGVRASLTRTARMSGAFLGFVVLLNLDVLLARHHLPAAVSGEYAVGAIVTKVTFWLPQGIGIVLLPGLAEAEHRRRTLPVAVGVVAAVGGVLTLATAALGRQLMPLLGGSGYGGSLGGTAWLFAALGTLLAIAQLLLYSGIAAADRLSTIAVWTAALLECVVVELLAATGRLTVATTVTAAAGTAALLVCTGLLRLGRSGDHRRG